ncbi:protein phosphatase 1K, mitochondrial isoform X1 [Folsomia candida]|uniref:protein phosphatase 1K, mitochondrial isoform X1 n=1 Tax=Folsomia candida TaxID=158441 RepID=UPI000B8F662E|nr:protein phosphatase 1K, mitochondrial isoform X1 [Folsomia candida]
MDRRIIMGICTSLQKRRFRTLFSGGGSSANTEKNAGVSPIFSRVCGRCEENNWNSNARWKSSQGTKTKSSSSSSSFVGASAKLKKRKESLDSLGTWDTATDLPLEVDATIASGKPVPSIRANNVGVSSGKGRRTYMEDQYGVGNLNGDPSALYLAVFDGHGSDVCANFCATIFPKHLAYWFQNPDVDVPTALHKSFLEVNNAFASWYIFGRRGPDIKSSGSTATICILKDNIHLFIGHVGDSRAILCRSGEARKLTTDHDPSLITEKTRIERSGGRISDTGRVNERLAMSRSIGDHELKRFGVIAAPDVISMKIDHSRDSFLVLTTDGINNVMTDTEIINTVLQTKDPQYAATLLTETAFEYSSEDNITALVIPLGSWGKYSAAATIFHSFGKSFTSSSRFS